jgi:hypothetical protein
MASVKPDTPDKKRKRDPACKCCGADSDAKFTKREGNKETFYCSSECFQKNTETPEDKIKADKWLSEVTQMNKLAYVHRQFHARREEFNAARGSEAQMKALLNKLIPEKIDYMEALKASNGNLEEAVDAHLEMSELYLQAAIDANLELGFGVN